MIAHSCRAYLRPKDFYFQIREISGGMEKAGINLCKQKQKPRSGAGNGRLLPAPPGLKTPGAGRQRAERRAQRPHGASAGSKNKKFFFVFWLIFSNFAAAKSKRSKKQQT